jgi:hypothetical protein
LDQRPVPTWISQWAYGIAQPNIEHIQKDDQTFSHVEGLFFHNENLILEDASSLQTVHATAFGYFIIFKQSLCLLSSDGELIDHLLCGRDLPSGPIGASAHQNERLILKFKEKVFQSEDALNWEPLVGEEPSWSMFNSESATSEPRATSSESAKSEPRATESPKTLNTQPDPEQDHHHKLLNREPSIHQASILSHPKLAAIDWERFLLDLHSGRVAGNLGVWVMEISAWMMILLTLSGLWIQFKRR